MVDAVVARDAQTCAWRFERPTSEVDASRQCFHEICSAHFRFSRWNVQKRSRARLARIHDGFPDVKLDELLDELTISGGDEAAGGDEGGAASSSSQQQPADEGPAPGPLGPISFAPPPGASGVAQFELPGGNDNAKFFF